jgi:hypothetical protein
MRRPDTRAVLPRALALVSLLAAAAAAEEYERLLPAPGSVRSAPVNARPSAPTLTVRPAAVTPARTSAMHLQAVFDRNYPALETALDVGAGGGLQISAGGLFRHHRVVTAAGDSYLDADSFEAGARWGMSAGAVLSGSGVSAAAGIETAYSRAKDSAGGYAFKASRWSWADTTLSFTGSNESRITTAFRVLRNQSDGTSLTALSGGMEISPILGVAPVGEYTFLLKNPAGVRRPWAAGFRIPLGGSWLVCYVSNTAGSLAAESLAGTGTTFLTVRLHAVF